MPPLFISLCNATVGELQLSASSVTTLILATGILAIHRTFTDAGLLAVGLVLSSTVIVCEQVAELLQSSETV